MTAEIKFLKLYAASHLIIMSTFFEKKKRINIRMTELELYCDILRANWFQSHGSNIQLEIDGKERNTTS